MNDAAIDHFGQWYNVILWIVLGLVFLLFTPFYKKSQRKPSTVYVAFIVAMAFEMFGIPMSMYILAWAFGGMLPDGILWGHTLYSYIGHTGMLVGTAFMLTGVALVVMGWRVIYKRYWSKAEGQGELVTEGIYRYIRHPQYTGFLMITFGMLLDWATLPMLIMWPVMAVLYTRLAKREETEMEAQFGREYIEYRHRTGMFLPKIAIGRQRSVISHS